MKRRGTLIVGASSGIGRAIAQRCAQRGEDLVLAGRDPDALEATASDLRIRYDVSARTVIFDALDFSGHERTVERCFLEPSPRMAIVCVGYLGDQRGAENNFEEALDIIEVNFTACVGLVDQIARRMVDRGGGAVGVISSVAGERGRPSNYYYGAAKSGLSTYLEGLGGRLRGTVSVTDLRLGPVDTRMSYGRRSPLIISPGRAATAILRAVERGRPVAYIPGVWRSLAWVMRLIPSFVLARLRI